MRATGSRAVNWTTAKTGYQADQLTAGLQVGLGALVLLAALSPPAVWNALSLQPAAITPVYAVVTFCVVLQPNLGSASQFVLMRAAGAVVGGLAGLTCMYITYAANGASYAATPTKAAVMVALLAALSFGLGVCRFRYPRYWFAFTVATFSMPMVALNPYHQDFVEYRALFYWWLQIALGIGTAAAVSTFVFPITAGRKVRLKTADALRQLAALTSAAVRHMVSLPLGSDGLAEGLSGQLDGRDAIDTGLSASFKPLYDTATAVGASLTQTLALLGVVGTEWNVYSRDHVLPREAFQILLHINRAYLSSVMALLYPLQSGRLALRAVQTVAREFQDAADLLAASLLAAADCVDRGAPFAEALAPLRRMEDRWHQLGALCPAINSSWGENEVLSSDMLVGTLFALGTRVRRVFFTLPEVLHRSQPEARRACYGHFKGGRVWDLSQPQEQLRQRAARRATTPSTAGVDGMLPSPRLSVLPSPRLQPFLAAPQLPLPRPAEREAEELLSASQEQQQPQLQPPTGAAGKVAGWQKLASGRLFSRRSRPVLSDSPPATAPPHEPIAWHQLPAGATGAHGSPEDGCSTPRSEALWAPPDAAAVAERFPPTLYLPPPAPGGCLAAALAAAHDRTGVTSEHVALALQLAAAMAAACTLHVVDATYQALHEKTIWVVVTVCVVLESAMGGLVLKCGLRVAGTSVAAMLGMGVLGLVVLCNSGTYANAPPKFVAMCSLLPACLAVLMATHVRWAAPYGYVWSCAKFTTPIIALSGYVDATVQWSTAAWRLANILAGIALDLAASCLVLPVTSRRATQRRVQVVLEGLAELAEAVLLRYVDDGGPPGGQQQQQQQPGGPATPGRSARRRGVRPARTPLSHAEAAELAAAAFRPTDSVWGRQQGGAGSPRAPPSTPSRTGSPRSSLGRESWSPSAAAAAAPEPTSARGRLARLLRRPSTPASATDADVEAGARFEAASVGNGSPGTDVPLAAVAVAPAGAWPRAAAVPMGGSPRTPVAGAPGLPPRPPPVGGAAVELPPLSLGGAMVAAPLAASPFGLAAQQQQEQQPAQLPPAPVVEPSPRTARRGGASQPPDLPTVVSQQALHLDDLPALPPLHIPLHHQLTVAEEEAASAASDAAAAPGSAAPGSAASPRGGAEQAGRAALTRRPSATSTVFYQGTPRARAARRRRSAWLRERALGPSFVAVHALGAELAATIAHMHELALFARYEWVPCHTPHRMKPQDILAAQHAFRKLLNVLLSIPYLADSPDVPRRRLLMPHPREVRSVAEQLGEALRALVLVLEGGLAVDRALAMVFNLQLQVQLLLLEVEQEGPAAGASQADSVLGVTTLGVLFAATQTVQLAYRCVLRLLGTPQQHAAAERAFARSAAWGASVEAVLVARGVVLASLATGSDEAGTGAAAPADLDKADAEVALQAFARERGD